MIISIIRGPSLIIDYYDYNYNYNYRDYRLSYPVRYCREMKIDVWEGAWRRAGEETLPRRGVG